MNKLNRNFFYLVIFSLIILTSVFFVNQVKAKDEWCCVWNYPVEKGQNTWICNLVDEGTVTGKDENCAATATVYQKPCSQVNLCPGASVNEIPPQEPILEEKSSTANKEIKEPVPNFPFPGLNLTYQVDCQDGKCTYTFSWIGQYIVAFYRWSIILLIVLSLVIITQSGFMWLMAGGLPDKIKEAKTSIVQAILGLVLGILASQIMAIINPALNIFKPITLSGIPRVEWEPMDTENMGGLNGSVSSGGVVASVGGECFPVRGTSLQEIRWDWGNTRADKDLGLNKRCHAGVDILTKDSGEVLAIADGKVVNDYWFFNCSGGSSNALIIDHGEFVVLYGEIDSGSQKVKVGSTVEAGQILGNATRCGMLHFELYQKGANSSSKWSPPDGKTVGTEANYCRTNYLSTKPKELLDPTETLKSLQSKTCN